MAKLDRTDPRIAEGVLRKILPDESDRRAWLEFFADTIEELHVHHPDRWGVTLHPRVVRLNLAMAEIFRFQIREYPDDESEKLIVVYVDAVALPAQLAQQFEPSGLRYLPDALMAAFLPGEAAEWIPLLKSPQRVLLGSSQGGPCVQNRKDAHSPGVITFLSEYLGRRIPHPGYFQEQETSKASPMIVQRKKTEKRPNDVLSVIKRQGLFFPTELITNYLLALQTRRFVILSGISGTGKTQLALAVAKHFRPQQTRIQRPIVPDGAATLTVRAYMQQHTQLTLPASLLGQMRLAPPDEYSRGREQVVVKYPAGQETLSLWYDATRSLYRVYLKGGLRRWFRQLTEGTTLILDIDEGDDASFDSLRFSVAETEPTQEPPKHYCVVPVRPDWHDNRGLLGYYNPLTGRYVMPEFLRMLLHAQDEETRAHEEERTPQPFFVILDEMNLARVEQYFSDFLSALESGEEIELHHESHLEVDEQAEGVTIPPRLHVPSNVFFTGTVNVDETTYMFSPKVLDRAFTLECHHVDLEQFGVADASVEYGGFTLEKYPASLAPPAPLDVAEWQAFAKHADGALQQAVVQLNTHLQPYRRHFGYRVANEIARFVNLAAAMTPATPAALWTALDLALLQKVLPKFHGTQEELDRPLRVIFAFALSETQPVQPWAEWQDTWHVVGNVLTATAPHEGSTRLPRLAAKVWRMGQRLQERGFTSFIE